MCGRFVGRFSFDDLIEELRPQLDMVGAEIVPSDMPPFENYNVAPTQMIPVVRADVGTPRVEIEPMRWGLVPSWSKDPAKGSPLINARSETVTEKPSFRNLVSHHRCIIPMTGFFEWDRSDPKHKIPYFVPRADGRTMWALGLWSRPRILDGLATATMLTCQSTGPLARIHDRSPVQLDVSHALEWVLEDQPPLDLIDTPSMPEMRPYKVSTLVNSIRNNGPRLLDEENSDARDEGRVTPPGLFD